MATGYHSVEHHLHGCARLFSLFIPMSNPLTPDELARIRAQHLLLQDVLTRMDGSASQSQSLQDHHQIPFTTPPIPLSQQDYSNSPLTQSYQSPLAPSATLGHPSPAVLAASHSHQPFLGLNSLRTTISGHVNQQRLASSAQTPRRPSLSRRGSRRRGPAIPTPALPRLSQPSLTSCATVVERGGGVTDVMIRIKVKVYPPPVNFFSCQPLCDSNPHYHRNS
jgi:hypothetical protein